MVDTESSSDEHENRGSDYFVPTRSNHHGMGGKGVTPQLDGVNDERHSRSEGRFPESATSSPKYALNSSRTGRLQVRNRGDTPTTELESSASSYMEPRQHSQNRAQDHQYIAYNPHSRQPSPLPPPSIDDFDERSFPSESRLFDDFDGVHCEIDLHLDPPHQQSRKPPNRYGSRPMSYAQQAPQPQQPQQSHQFQQPQQPQMVYYPAPVPAMINLPPTLSKPRGNRESQILKNRKSMAAVPYNVPTSPVAADPSPVEDKKKDFRRSLANLPPQLRASVFFDQPVTSPVEVERKEESAVATLDSILDAAAKAPPAAFTEHPIAAGPSFQRPEHARSKSSVVLQNRQSMASLGNHLNNRHSVANMGAYRSSVALVNDERPHHVRQSSQLSLPDGMRSRGESSEGNLEQPQEYDFGRPDSQVFGTGMHPLPPTERNTPSPMPSHSPAPDHNALPTTLMAELEARKAQLRSRTRTAASSFPTGMRSTLLELDAVAQVQKKTRAQRRTNLAWENPEGVNPEERDEDVPLGLLYAGANQNGGQTRKHDNNAHHHGGDEDVPLGLIVKREMEDNEPLSKRKERLRGVTVDAAAYEAKRGTVYLDIPGISAPQQQDKEEAEEETLAARQKRMRDEKEREKTGFGSGSLGMTLDTEEANVEKKKSPVHTPVGEKEETLGQRRRRLQQEKDQRDKLKRESMFLQQEVRQRNMIDIIQHQQNLPLHMRSQSAMAGMLNPGANAYSGANGYLGAMPGVNTPLAGGGMLGMGGGSHATGLGTMTPAMAAMAARPQSTIMMGGGMGMPYGAGMPMPMPMQMATPIPNTKQMEMVERWRSSVMGGNPN